MREWTRLVLAVWTFAVGLIAATDALSGAPVISALAGWGALWAIVAALILVVRLATGGARR